MPPNSTSPPSCWPCCATPATEPRPDTQLEALTLAVAADLPVLLWGEPGIGKTAALTQLAAALDLPLTTVIASVHEPSDFSGLPVVGDDPAEQGVPMAPPDWAVRLVRAGRGLLFLDELSTAPPAVQAALLRLVLERRVGALQLPPGVRIVAAANPRSSAADGWELSPPLANRFVHLQWTHDHEVVVRGLGGTWPRATLPRLDPERLSRRRGLRPPRGVRAPLRPPRTRAPAAQQRSPPGRPVAVAPELGDDAVPDRLRHRGRLLPGSAVAAGQGHGGGRAGAGAAGQPGPDGPAGPRGRCSPTRRAPSCPSGAICARPCSTVWWRRSASVRTSPAGTPRGRCWSGRWRPEPRTWWSSPRPRWPRCASEDWDVPASIERLAGAVSLSRRADQRRRRTDGRGRGEGGPMTRPDAPRTRAWTSRSCSPPGCTPPGSGPTWRRRCSPCTPWSRGGCRRWPSTGTGGATSRRRSWTGRRWRNWPGYGCTRCRTCCATITGAATGSRGSAA